MLIVDFEVRLDFIANIDAKVLHLQIGLCDSI